MKPGIVLLMAFFPWLAVPPWSRAQQPELVVQAGHSSWIGELDFSPDGRWLASAGDGVNVWELTTGRVWRSFGGHTGEVSGAAFSPGGSLLASCSQDGTIKIWEVETGREMHTLDGHSDPVNAVAFSPDGRRLASAAGETFGGNGDNTVRLWNVSTGQELLTLRGHESEVSAVAFSPDGTLLASSSYDKTVRIWDVRTGREVRTLSGHTDWVPSVTFSLDGRLLATASYDETVKLWEVGTGREIRTLTHPLDVTTVRFSPDGHWLASTAYNEDVRLWEVSTGRMVHTFQGRPGALAFSPDSRHLASKGPGMGRAIQLWEVQTGRMGQTLGGSVAPPHGLAMSADGGQLASAGGGAIHLWEVASGRVMRTLTGHAGAVLALAFSSNAARLASLDNRGTVKLWEIDPERAIHTIQHEGEGEINALALSRDGHLLATGTRALNRGRPASGPNNTVTLRNSETGREAFTLTGHTDPVQALAFSPDGGLLASGSGGYAVSGEGDNSVRLWETSTGREVHTLVGHKAKVNAVAFSPDGSLLASGSGHLGPGDNTIRLWETSTGRERRVLEGHTDEVRAVAFSPDGSQLASASRDNTIKLWDVHAGREVRTLRGHTGPLTDIAFAPDGRYLVSGSQDGSMRLWDAASGEELALLATMERSDEWVAVSSEGLFDGSSQGMQALVAWRIGTRTYPPDRFFAAFYTPGLLTRLLLGEQPKAEVDLATLNLPPDVRILSPADGSTPEQRQIDVTVEVEDKGSGVAEVRLYHNGKQIAALPGQPGETSKYTFREVVLIAGDNELRVSALNEDQVESNDHWVRVSWSARNVGPVDHATVDTSRATLHVLVVGIDQYADAALNLNYARPDAEAIAGFFGQPGELFNAVNHIELFDEEATLDNIQKAFDELAQQAQPEDVLLIYLAGHGVTLGQQFYFLPHEMRWGAGDVDDAVREYGMPATMLGDALFHTKALKQVLIIDACQSEGALDVLAMTVQRGPAAQQKALKMLARAKGVYMVAASTKQQYAYEVPQLGHGVLTYALLCGMGGQGLQCGPGAQGRPQAATNDGIVTMDLLLDYISWQVPKLTEQYHGSLQDPVVHRHGMNFPLWVEHR